MVRISGLALTEGPDTDKIVVKTGGGTVKLKVLLTIPRTDNKIEEMAHFLQEGAPLTVFPEGFLHNEILTPALKLTAGRDGLVISGFKHWTPKGVYEKALVIENGRIVGGYTKCILTKTEQAKGKLPGPAIHCVDTRLGRIGIPICYEIHFPEVSRVMALDSPFLLLNLIGTGMYHAQQYSQWTALARARAIENEVYVVGCSHCAGEIPLAFAYSPSGELLGELVNTHGSLSLELDTAESANRPLGYLDDRLPTYFTRLCC